MENGMFSMSAGQTESSSGASLRLESGWSRGGDIVMATGHSATLPSGSLELSTGISNQESGGIDILSGDSDRISGSIKLSSGHSSSSKTGDVSIATGLSDTSAGGNIAVTAGPGTYGGDVSIFAGDGSSSRGGSVLISSGNHADVAVRSSGGDFESGSLRFSSGSAIGGASGGIIMHSGDVSDARAGLIDIGAGRSVGVTGADVTVHAGHSSHEGGALSALGGDGPTGGSVSIHSGRSTTGQAHGELSLRGGYVSLQAGKDGLLTIGSSNSENSGGVSISSGNSLTSGAGSIDISAGSSGAGNGATVSLLGGQSEESDGGMVTIGGGRSEYATGGDVTLIAGSGGKGGGKLFMKSSTDSDKIEVTDGGVFVQSQTEVSFNVPQDRGSVVFGVEDSVSGESKTMLRLQNDRIVAGTPVQVGKVLFSSEKVPGTMESVNEDSLLQRLKQVKL
jgi:hypothetical protein